MIKNYNENYVKEAAYYNWMNAGCPAGNDEYFWNMAINQIYGSTCCCSKTSSTKSCSSKSTSCKKTSTKTSKK